jgi:hypothetical protein
MKWPLNVNNFNQEDIEKICLFLKDPNSRWTQDNYVEEFENKMANFAGSKYSIFVSSGSTANTLIAMNLKDNFKYNIESEDLQVLRSPASIMNNKVGIDCKNYSLCAAGLLDAYRRKEKLDFGLDFRFASYDPFNKTPQHVFVVIKENGKEYWLDPVLDEYDLKKQPYYYKDKKINKMALIALSGIGEVTAASSGSQITTGSSWWETILKAAPSIISAFPSGGGTGSQYMQPYQGYVTTGNQNIPQAQSSGISTNTILLVAGVGLAAYLLLKKK